MNYSTIKKTVALSFVTLLAFGLSQAQTATTDSAKTSAGTAKVFGGLKQYNTWSVGLNVGVTSPSVFTGGVNQFTGTQLDLGYGVSLRDQLSHAFGLQLDVHGGQVKGSGNTYDISFNKTATQFSTNFWSGSLSGVINVGSLSFLHRTNAVNFYVNGGAGLIMYTPKVTFADGTVFDWGNPPVAGKDHTGKYVHELVLPVGAGVKFKLSDALALNVGYTENFIDGFNFEGVNSTKYPANNKYSYGYAGLEYTFGPKSKPNLDWVNPVAMMYDELYDAALRQEVEALKGRVGNVENAINDLKKDSDGDGVADQFDKCPNTPAGTVVDGSGCPINFPKIDTSLFMRKPVEAPAQAYSNIQFEFDSSVLRTSSYPSLDLTSQDLRSNADKKIELDGFASSEGTAAHNMRLSRDRANSVKTYLVNSGVDSKRIKVKAFGETHPIADNSTEAGRILNRRVEFKQK
ncbi:MAG: OmpA family protein [Bacteroidetes bacterium]|nr:OmpA family protein [Bacteroidota bacterium]